MRLSEYLDPENAAGFTRQTLGRLSDFGEDAADAVYNTMMDPGSMVDSFSDVASGAADLAQGAGRMAHDVMMDPGKMVGALTEMHPMDTAALATAFVPVVGDLTEGANLMRREYNDDESDNPAAWEYGLAAVPGGMATAGMIPKKMKRTRESIQAEIDALSRPPAPGSISDQMGVEFDSPTFGEIIKREKLEAEMKGLDSPDTVSGRLETPEIGIESMTPSRTGETVEVFSGSYAPHPSEIEPYDERGPFNIFGGVFGSTRKEVAESHGDFIKKYDVDTGMMLKQGDLDNDEISVQLAKRLGISQDEASDVLTSYKRDEFSNDDAARLLGMSDSGEAGWEMQAKIGDAARKAGYDAVELPDEHGTSILVLNNRLPQAGRLETPEVPREKTIAYHGSPHDFPPVRELQMPDGARVYQSMNDAIPEGAKMLKEHPLGRFNMSKIGTGEGAQAYGHGLYFAEAEDVARRYRDTLTPRDLDYEEELLRRYNALERSGNYEKMEMYEKAMQHDTPADFRDIASDLDYDDDYRQMAADMADEIEELAPDLGAMYQVEIDASPDEFLDWDLPLSEQSIFPKEATSVKAARYKEEGLSPTPADMMQARFEANAGQSGEGFYNGLLRGNKTQAEATSALQNAGIKGIRYKDEFSRGADGGTSNYVVFDENLISIARKYGIAIPAAAAMLARQTGQNPQDLYEEDST